MREVAGIICMGNCAPDVMKLEADTLWYHLISIAINTEPIGQKQHTLCENLSQAIDVYF